MSLRLEEVRPSVVTLVIVAIAMLHAVAPAWAQDVAALCGRVFDATGAALPAASVRMRHPDGAIVGATQTGNDGRYCIADLAAGVYRVIVSASGFRDEIIPKRDVCSTCWRGRAETRNEPPTSSA